MDGETGSRPGFGGSLPDPPKEGVGGTKAESGCWQRREAASEVSALPGEPPVGRTNRSQMGEEVASGCCEAEGVGG